MFDDFRYALRSVVRSRGLTAVLLVSLALGTGANAAVSGAILSLFFRAPPGVGGGGLVEIHTRQFSGSPFGNSSYPDYVSMRSLPSIDILAACDDQTTHNARIGMYERGARIARVTPDYFTALRMEPLEGQLFTAADAAASLAPAVISESLWDDVGRPADIAGRTMIVGQLEVRVVGVAASRFRGLRTGRPVDVWIASESLLAEADRGDRRLSLVGRLIRGASMDAVNRELEGLAGGLAGQHPGTNRGTLLDPDAPRVLSATPYSPLDPSTRGRARLVASLVVGAVVLLLISSCVNAGSLLLARTSARRRELAIRIALGGTSRRAVRQLVRESLLISLCGAGLGILFAYWTADVIPALFAPEHAALVDTRVDWRLVLPTVAIVSLAGVLFALVPVRQGIAAPSATLLRGDPGDVAGPRGGSRVRAILVGSQVALSTLLLLGTTMLVTGLSAALRGGTGSSGEQLAILTVERRTPQIYQEPAAAGLAKLTGVEDAAWTSQLPLGRRNVQRFQIVSRPIATDTADFEVAVVSSRYFETMGVDLVEGRRFDARDGFRAEPVAIVDEALARLHLGDRAEGRHLVEAEGVRRTIVGVVRAPRYRTLQAAPEPTVYYPVTQQPLWRGYIVVRTTGPASGMLPQLGRRLELVDSSIERGRTFTFETHLSEALLVDRMTTTLVGVCGVLALVMAVIRVYGVMSDAVHRRTREIGLRVALGAGPMHVVALVLAEARWWRPPDCCSGRWWRCSPDASPTACCSACHRSIPSRSPPRQACWRWW